MLILFIIIALMFSGFFSGMEIAFVSSNRMQAEIDTKNAGILAKPLSVFYKHPDHFVSTMLIGNNITLVIYGIVFAKLFDSTIFAPLAEDNPGLVVALDTILSTIIVLFTGEFLPKILFKSRPNSLLKIFALPAFLCYIILYPITLLATGFSRVFIRLLGYRVQTKANTQEFSKIDLDYLVNDSIEHAKAMEETEGDEAQAAGKESASSAPVLQVFQNALQFTKTQVRDCIVPRTEIIALPNTVTVREVHQKAVQTGRSKIVIYDKDIDHIIGYIHSSQLFSLKNSDTADLPLVDIIDSGRQDISILSLPTVTVETSARRMMQIFLAQKKSLAVVLDEFGGTEGIVSLEDICEEIFGEIEDEHDKNTLLAKEVAPGEYVVSARQEIDNVNEIFDLSLPTSGDYITIAGLVLHVNKSFPAVGDVVEVDDYRIKILKKTNTKIELVKITTER